MLTPYVARTDRDPRLLAEQFKFRLHAYGHENHDFWAHIEASPEVIERWRLDPEGGVLGIYDEDNPCLPAWLRHPAPRLV